MLVSLKIFWNNSNIKAYLRTVEGRYPGRPRLIEVTAKQNLRIEVSFGNQCSLIN